MDVRMPDGTIVQNVPDGITKAELVQKLHANGHDVGGMTIPSAQPESKPDTFLGMDTGKLNDVAQGLRDAGGGIARSGMGLVSNLQRPLDYLTGDSNDSRMAKVDQRFRNEYGVNPDSAAFQATKLGGDIALTSPIGGALGAGVKAVSKAPAVTAFANALASGGMSTGNNLVNASRAARALDMGTRVAGGAITGGAMSGAIDLNNAGTGALIGGALPPGLKIAAGAGKLIKKGADAVATNLLGATTGTGAESIKAAYNAGKNKSTAFLDNMRGKVSFNDVVDEAKSALQKMRIDRGNDYRSGMVDISNDKSVIPFQPIQDAVNNVVGHGSYKGLRTDDNASATVQALAKKVQEWGSVNPAEYHTPEGLDALKQAIGDIRDNTQFGTAARRAADEVYHAIKNQITAQAPTYSKVMKNYSEASDLLKEIQSGLSLGPNASRDTAVRKLQSLLRNNVSTNYGNRLNLANTLENKGGADLMPAIAGQSMSSAMPRGLIGAGEKGGAILGALLNPASIPAIAAAAPFASPRLVGEGLYGLGRMTGGAGNLLNYGKQGMNRLVGQHPGLLDLENALYRSVPVMATSANR